MGIEFAPLTEDNAADARALLLDWWDQDWDRKFAEEFFDWRYLSRSVGGANLAFDGRRCVGIIDSFLRPYLLHGERVLIRETCDWFCLEQYRPLGIGLKLIRQFMERPEPIISIGGLEPTLVLLPRLKWQRLDDVETFFLPISARMLAADAARRLRIPGQNLAALLPRALTLRSPRMMPMPPEAEISIWRSGELAPLPHGDSHELIALLSNWDREWWSAAPARLGKFVGLLFSIGGEPVGVSFSRIERCTPGARARIIHLQFSNSRDEVLDWAIAETARYLMSCGVELIRCRSSCTITSKSLRRCGFLAWKPSPTFWWSGADRSPPRSTYLTYNRADDSLTFKR
jgi:hypothetical protein